MSNHFTEGHMKSCLRKKVMKTAFVLGSVKKMGGKKILMGGKKKIIKVKEEKNKIKGG